MENLKISDQLLFSDKTVDNHSPKKLIGEVTINEYDKDKKLVSTETGHNEIILPGSVFTLEQLFKVKATGEFKHPTSIPIGDSITVTLDESTESAPSNISTEKIFGFMVGNGGSGASGVLSGSYMSNSLVNTSGSMSCIPFRIIDGTTSNSDLNKLYAMGGSDSSKYYYFAKKFTGDVVISTKTVDGSQTSITSITDTSSEVVTYAEAKMIIDKDDVRAYYNNSTSGAIISQVGLVAGFPYLPTGISDTDEMQYSDIRLVTSYNFKERDFNNPGNTLEMIYRVYCV